MARDGKSKGVSLAKGPAALIGMGMLAWGILNLLFGGSGGRGFTTSPIDGTVNGGTFLGAEGNGWTNLLWIGAGALLLFGAPLHWGAKTLALVTGLVLGAASVISLVDGTDVFGIFAANGLTKLLWGAVATALLVIALLPRVGGKKRDDDRDRHRRDSTPQPTTRERERVVERDPVVRERDVVAGTERDERLTRRRSSDRDDLTGARDRDIVAGPGEVRDRLR